MNGIAIPLASILLVLSIVRPDPCPAGEGRDLPVASVGDAERNASLSVRFSPPEGGRTRAVARISIVGQPQRRVLEQADAVARRAVAAGTAAARIEPPAAALPAGPPDIPADEDSRPHPAVSLDRRVPAAQPGDREGLSLVGVLGAVGDLRRAFSRERDPSSDEGVARVVRTLRDSVFGKRISILSESGDLSESEPYLVGLSFTH